MVSFKIAPLFLVGFVVLSTFIDARPAPADDDKKTPGKHVHHHHVKKGSNGGGGKGDGGNHVHHYSIGSKGTNKHHFKTDGGTHVHHFSTAGKDGGTHVHHFSTGGKGGGGDSGDNTETDINISDKRDSAGGSTSVTDVSGSSGGDDILGGLKLTGFSPETIAKFKKFLTDNNIDLSKIDLSKLGLGGAGGAGGAGGGGGALHKFDGKDSLQPAMCDDSINDRYGVGKHFVRGTRDVGFAILSEAETILDPLLGGITHGLGQGLKAVLCAIEDGFSDFGSDWDSATDIAKHGLVNFFKLQGPHPVLGIPIGIGGIAGEAVKAAASIAGDAVEGVENGIGELAKGLGLGK